MDFNTRPGVVHCEAPVLNTGREAVPAASETVWLVNMVSPGGYAYGIPAAVALGRIYHAHVPAEVRRLPVMQPVSQVLALRS